MSSGAAVVTGGAGGLGRALCARLADTGRTVVGADLAGADRVLDVTDADACRALATELDPEVWVNNAGVLGAGEAATQPDAEIETVVRVNLLGVINGTRAAVSTMRDRPGGGTILNVGSMASWTPVPGETVYAATKAGVLAFSAGIAAELRDTDIRVCVLCPDGIWSPMLADRLDDELASMSFSGPRLLEPEEVADEAMSLLASSRFTRSIPRWRGVTAKLVGTAPGVVRRAYPLFHRIGLRNQERLRRERATRSDESEETT